MPTMKNKKLQIAVDGPVAAGKDTIGYLLGKALGLTYIDAGAIYRSLVFIAEILGLDLAKDKKKIFEYFDQNFKIELGNQVREKKILHKGKDITDKLYSFRIGKKTTELASISKYRKPLLEFQRRLVDKLDSVIMTGRGIARLVMPNADLKLYLDADEKERAKRYLGDDKRKGDKLDLKKALEIVREIDKINRERKFDPDKPVEGATVLDTANLTIEEVVSEVIKSIRKL